MALQEYPSIPSIRMKKKDGDRIIKIKENTHERLKNLENMGKLWTIL